MSGIEDVASLAGVSKATVSRALSGRGYVSADTRLRVEAAASSLGYVVSSSASSLVTGRTNNVGVIIPMISQWFFASILEGVERALLDRGYDLMLYNVTKTAEERTRVFEYFLVRKRVDAVIAVTLEITPEETQRMLALGKPIAGIGGPLEGIPTLSIDDVEAARLATEHLLLLGHRDIMHVGGDVDEQMDFHVHSKRLKGYMEALTGAGIRYDESSYAATPFDIPGGYRVGKQILGDPRRRPTAIFAAADEVAIGVILAARELGISVPDDLSVIGIDNHPLAELFGLTSIEQRPDLQGEQAVDWVIRQLEQPGWAPPVNHTVLPVRLVMRSSTAPPRPRA
ncbi:LacI family DNA-binding transcriptional regulator [Herbiconiux sp. KACC 21604]|uniref:LacI family DNA-binding transcriptional regulator n=1 Tax=unclassified Herbiconiux TaxID=2618217 RepID=UPI00149252CF|nr:LacI family DNA-binding transcriptional regulator [Herbiconiux sp. SALV-R1]QJU54677.1 LacI family DNA-binding transcriptional regulator [Herbiconiux sp. SALV-R1]WPO85779.1 LacI family DNA-binding transcriptional regulator [Herbiconiux sp. KACC 21604]